MSISDYEFVSGLTKMGFIGNPGVSKQDLAMIAERLDIKIPQKLEEFYLYSNGSSNSFGPYLWKFLPIDSQTTSLAYHVGPRNYGKFKVNQRSFNPEKYIIFLDCLIELCMRFVGMRNQRILAK